jgi:hypothetical protein
MAKRSTGSTPVGGSRKRPAPTKVSKPFPWGVVAGGTVLGAALIGIVVYAALNAGSGAANPLPDADEKFPGLSVTPIADLQRDHVVGPVEYDQPVPVGGPHNVVPQQCGVYAEQIAAEHALHSLEHGAVWVTYQPDLPADDVQELADEVGSNRYGLLSPVPDQESPVLLTAWGRQLALDSADMGRVGEFLNTYASGPQSPELGAACAGTSSTGATPVGGAPAPPPLPSGEPSPAS